MSRLQSTLCRSAPWRATAGTVLRWSLHGFVPHGEVLEIGAGSGAMAAEVLDRYPAVTAMTVTDVDPAMVEVAAARLARHGARASTQQADATALPFADGTFDVVLSWVMLHHTVGWEQAVAEALRVLKPGGHLVGYDLLATRPLRALHRNDGDRIRLLSLDELRATLGDAGEATVEPALARQLVRFTIRKR